MPIIDTHVHYNLEPLYSGKIVEPFGLTSTQQVQTWQNHWQKAQENGVKKSIVVGTNSHYNQLALEISKQNKNLLVSLAYHPESPTNKAKTALKNQQNFLAVEKMIEENLNKLENLIKNHQDNKIVAIGETGLDYFQISKKGLKRDWIIKAQQFAFKLHFTLAKKYHLPLIIHVRDEDRTAYDDALDIILKNYESGQQLILHCISGPLDYIKKALDLGVFIGIDGNVTYQDKRAHNVQEILAIAPHDKILIETDAPFLAPVPYRGQLCEPWMITHTSDYLKKHFDLEEEQIYENSLKAFNLANF